MYLFATIQQSQSIGARVDPVSEAGSDLANGRVARGSFNRHRLDSLLKQTEMNFDHVVPVGVWWMRRGWELMGSSARFAWREWTFDV